MSLFKHKLKIYHSKQLLTTSRKADKKNYSSPEEETKDKYRQI